MDNGSLRRTGTNKAGLFGERHGGAPILFVERTVSTMDDARTFAAAHPEGAHGTVVMAGYQEKGRGRFPSRTWYAEEGKNLLMTVILEKELLHKDPSLVPLLAGLALCLVCENGYGLAVSVKWPNDILCGGLKVAGILCESDHRFVYCGVGINLNQKEFPADLRAVSVRTLTGKEVPPPAFLACFLNRLEWSLRCVEWRTLLYERLHGKGQPAEVSLPGKADLVRGTISAIAENGALVLENGSGRVEVVAGEVKVV